ncbi:MAG: response regulator transcription factor [Peptoniphilaceae bacterium]|nr:response regulator transcription factor [Peptoniphilaceae bacterium]MDY6019748.1 response regulator transcription factor [Anaerococcus sp.]
MKKITIVEDDKILYKELEKLFENQGYQVTTVDSFKDAHKEIEQINPDLAILDINLPETSGFVICKYLKENTSIPVLMLTGRDTLEDELESLNLGADEYLTKPCNPTRLVARAKKLMKIYEKLRDVILIGDVALDISSYKLSYKDDYVIFPMTEGEILRKLMEAYPKPVGKEDLLEEVWSSKYIDENILQVNLTRIRKKLKAIGLNDAIVNVRAIGYKFEYKD